MKTGEPSRSESLVATLIERGLTIAVAESLTGGMLTAELTSVAGASKVVLGGVVAYNAELKRRMLGVDNAVLREHGTVHPDVAVHMAMGVRVALAVADRPADIGISTTGVAGPDEVDGHPVGTVYLGFAIGDRVHVQKLALAGDRAEIRRESVSRSISELVHLLA